MNTPDAEWEKELRKKIQMFFYNAEHPEVYSSYEIAMFERKVEGILSIFQNTVSSRDTYWKERVIKMIDDARKDIPKNTREPFELAEYVGQNIALDTLIDNLK